MNQKTTTMKPLNQNKMNEVEFLKKILNELSDAKYGEGLTFNISYIEMLISKRIKELKTKSE
jgi:hypothetical protein